MNQAHRTELLLVEDNPADVRLFREALSAQQSQIQLTVANTGEEALRILRDNPNRPDLIVLDLSLPGMSGDQVARALRAEHGPRTPRLVALSGYDDASLRDRCDASVFDGVGTKPDRLEDLERFLDEHVGA